MAESPNDSGKSRTIAWIRSLQSSEPQGKIRHDVYNLVGELKCYMVTITWTLL